MNIIELSNEYIYNKRNVDLHEKVNSLYLEKETLLSSLREMENDFMLVKREKQLLENENDKLLHEIRDNDSHLLG